VIGPRFPERDKTATADRERADRRTGQRSSRAPDQATQGSARLAPRSGNQGSARPAPRSADLDRGQAQPAAAVVEDGGGGGGAGARAAWAFTRDVRLELRAWAERVATADLVPDRARWNASFDAIATWRPDWRLR
jgi:hypothetical protein